jgi:hypothetical protein
LRSHGLPRNLQVVLQQSPVNALILSAFGDVRALSSLHWMKIVSAGKACKMWRKSQVLKNEAHFSLHAARL